MTNLFTIRYVPYSGNSCQLYYTLSIDVCVSYLIYLHTSWTHILTLWKICFWTSVPTYMYSMCYMFISQVMRTFTVIPILYVRSTWHIISYMILSYVHIKHSWNPVKSVSYQVIPWLSLFNHQSYKLPTPYYTVYTIHTSLMWVEQE